MGASTWRASGFRLTIMNLSAASVSIQARTLKRHPRRRVSYRVEHLRDARSGILRRKLRNSFRYQSISLAIRALPMWARGALSREWVGSGLVETVLALRETTPGPTLIRSTKRIAPPTATR